MQYHWGLGVGHYHAHQGVLRASENSPHNAESQDHDERKMIISLSLRTIQRPPMAHP